MSECDDQSFLSYNFISMLGNNTSIVPPPTMSVNPPVLERGRQISEAATQKAASEISHGAQDQFRNKVDSLLGIGQNINTVA